LFGAVPFAPAVPLGVAFAEAVPELELVGELVQFAVLAFVDDGEDELENELVLELDVEPGVELGEEGPVGVVLDPAIPHGGFCTSESVNCPAAFTWISRHSSFPVNGSMYRFRRYRILFVFSRSSSFCGNFFTSCT